MKPISTKIQALLISVFLLSTIGATIVALPSATAHYPAWTIPTWCYATVSPNPVGVNQQALIVFWTDKVPYTAVGAYGDRWTFTVEVTKPDGSKETLGPTTSDPVGGGYSYTRQRKQALTLSLPSSQAKPLQANRFLHLH